MTEQAPFLIEKFLPLHVKVAKYENDELVLEGNKWMLSVRSSWRLFNKDNFLFGCADDNVENALKEIENSEISNAKIQSNDFPFDLILSFSIGYKLEIFSDSSSLSWYFRLPNDAIINRICR